MFRNAKQVLKGVLVISVLLAIGFGASKATLAAPPEGVNSEHGEDWINDGGKGAPTAGPVRTAACRQASNLIESLERHLHRMVESAAADVLTNPPAAGDLEALSRNARIAMALYAVTLEARADKLSAEIADAAEAALEPYFDRIYDRECKGVVFQGAQEGELAGPARKAVCNKIDRWYARVEGRVFDDIVAEATAILSAQRPELPEGLSDRFESVLDRKFGTQFKSHAERLAAEIAVRSIASLAELYDRVRSNQCDG